jgi:hypothetical protein
MKRFLWGGHGQHDGTGNALVADGGTPREIKQDGRAIFHHRCVRCGRDFAQGLDGSGWHAVYVGVFKIDFLPMA